MTSPGTSEHIIGSPDFLRHVQPALVISAPPRFATPPEERNAWIGAVEALGIRAFCLEKTGAVHVTLDGPAVEARCYVDGVTFRSRAR